MKTWIDVLKILAECTEEAELDMDGVAVAKIEAIRQYVQKQQRLLLVDPLLYAVWERPESAKARFGSKKVPR